MTNAEQHPEELLPWYVNGTLTADELRQVETHLEGCDHCRSEVELLRTISDSAKQADDAGPGEMAWHRLRRDMRQDPMRRRRSWWKPSLAAAAALVIALQGVLLFSGAGRDGYGLAGHGPEGTVLQVKFNPDATEKEIRAILQAVTGEIVKGPSARGIYRIRLADGDAAALQARIERLRANHDVIDYLQRD